MKIENLSCDYKFVTLKFKLINHYLAVTFMPIWQSTLPLEFFEQRQHLLAKNSHSVEIGH